MAAHDTDTDAAHSLCSITLANQNSPGFVKDPRQVPVPAENYKAPAPIDPSGTYHLPHPDFTFFYHLSPTSAVHFRS